MQKSKFLLNICRQLKGKGNSFQFIVMGERTLCRYAQIISNKVCFVSGVVQDAQIQI